MGEPYSEAVATRTGPEPWRCGGDAVTQASVGVRAGWVWSRETFRVWGVEAIPPCRRPRSGVSISRETLGPRAVVDPMNRGTQYLFRCQGNGPQGPGPRESPTGERSRRVVRIEGRAYLIPALST